MNRHSQLLEHHFSHTNAKVKKKCYIYYFKMKFNNSSVKLCCLISFSIIKFLDSLPSTSIKSHETICFDCKRQTDKWQATQWNEKCFSVPTRIIISWKINYKQSNTMHFGNEHKLFNLLNRVQLNYIFQYRDIVRVWMCIVKCSL